VKIDWRNIYFEATGAATKTFFAILAVLGLSSVGILVYAFGWPIDMLGGNVLFGATNYLLLTFGLCELGLLLSSAHRIQHMRENLLSILAAIVALSLYLGSGRIYVLLVEYFGERYLRIGLITFIIITQMAVIVPLVLKWLRYGRRTWMTHVQPRTLVIGSFVLLILAGAGLLMTPNATTSGIRFVDALFTSTSAVCVTGLSVVDTQFAFTFHGQVVILILIQIGGLGLMTFTFFLSMLAGEGISLHDRVLLKDVISERNLGYISRILLEIVTVTAVIESIGAYIIWLEFQGVSLPGKGTLWHAVFHSISAFCNAGFSTISANLADPSISHNYALQATIMMLIILGGLGFPVLRELRQRFLSHIFPKHFERPSHMTLHSRLVLRATAFLLFGGAALIYLCQFVGSGPAPSLWRAMFDSVTSRTAGFSIADVGTYSVSVSLVIISLMFVGGSPAGTAGGIKTTTFALAVMNLWTTVREKKEIQIGWRSVSQRTANQAFAIMMISFAWIGLAVFAMTLVEPSMKLIDLLFETVSAFGTVGLSRGITARLCDSAKLILVSTMFIGRIGLIVIASALLHSKRDTKYNLPKEEVSLT
jgi:trk system potassium uptake protein